MVFFDPARRDHALDRACLSRGLRSDHARGYDDLPAAARDAAWAALVRRLEAGEIRRALAGATDLGDGLRAQLRALGTP